MMKLNNEIYQNDTETFFEIKDLVWSGMLTLTGVDN